MTLQIDNKYNDLFNVSPSNFMVEFANLLDLIFRELDFESDGYAKANQDLLQKINTNDSSLLNPNDLLQNYLYIVIINSKYDLFKISDDTINISLINSFLDEVKSWIEKTIIYKNKKKTKFFKLQFKNG